MERDLITRTKEFTRSISSRSVERGKDKWSINCTILWNLVGLIINIHNKCYKRHERIWRIKNFKLLKFTYIYSIKSLWMYGEKESVYKFKFIINIFDFYFSNFIYTHNVIGVICYRSTTRFSIIISPRKF